MEHSKAYITFKNRVLHFDDDLELIDVLKIRINREDVASENTDLFMDIDNEKHKNLVRYSVNDKNRMIVTYHLRTTLYSAYIKDMYEEVTQYFRSAIIEANDNMTVESARIVGEHKISMTAVEILDYLREGTLANRVINMIFQNLENEKSTLTLIEKSCKKLGVCVDKEIIEDAVGYLEIRHILVHADGKANEEFKKNHTYLSYDADGYIRINYQLIKSMKQAVFKLIETFDEDAISKNILRSHVE